MSEPLKKQIAQALPSQVKIDRFMRCLFTQVQRVPKLLQCERNSLFSAMITCSTLGIEPDGRRAHLIPFNNRKKGIIECQLIIDWKGLAELVMRSGSVTTLHADVICENDQFEYDKGRVICHKIDFKKPRGDAYAVYAMATFKDGTEKADVMAMEDVEKLRLRMKKGDGSSPWDTDYNEMAKKTVFRRLSKWLPLSAELHDAVYAGDDKPAELAVGEVFEAKTSLAAALEETPAVNEVDAKFDKPVAEAQEPFVKENLTTPTEYANPLRELESRIALDGVKLSKLESWAKKSGLDITKDTDAQKILNAWDSVVELTK